MEARLNQPTRYAAAVEEDDSTRVGGYSKGQFSTVIPVKDNTTVNSDAA